MIDASSLEMELRKKFINLRLVVVESKFRCRRIYGFALLTFHFKGEFLYSYHRFIKVSKIIQKKKLQKKAVWLFCINLHKSFSSNSVNLCFDSYDTFSKPHFRFLHFHSYWISTKVCCITATQKSSGTNGNQ